ncbi:MAG: hypothetical protein PVG07_07145, partial [Acidobacteriota bacterium]
PAGILLGLAVGSFFEEATVGEADWTLFGLGCGFFFIYALDRVYRGRRLWWPVVPGAILVLLAFPVTEDLFDLVFDHWPLLLVLIGLVIVLGALVRPRREPPPEPIPGAGEPASDAGNSPDAPAD